MHARASIPAWARPLAISVLVVALIVISVVAHREGIATRCANLRENIEMVRSGNAASRVSDGYRYRLRAGMPRLRLTQGDFRGMPRLDDVRACLGQSWTETHAFSQAEGDAEVWSFVRAGGPIVMYVHSHNSGGTEARIVIEPIDQQ